MNNGKRQAASILTASAAALLLAVAAPSASAAVLTQWTFETSLPAGTGTSVGPIAAETGTGNALAIHAVSSTISSPAGNVSAHSLSSNTWTVGDYYQFSFNSGTGLYLTFDQTSSNTGPRDFKIQTSDGTNSYSDLVTLPAVLANAAPNPTWAATNGSAIYTTSIALPDGTASIRLVDISTISANGGTVATAGTDRVDNVTISDAPLATPEPASLAVLALGGMALLARKRK